MKKNQVTILLMSIMLCTGVTIGVYVPALPTVASEFGATTRQMGWTMSSFIISASIAGLFASTISDRFGRKIAIIMTSSIFILTSLLLTITPNIEIFIFLRILQGSAAGFNFIVTRQIIRDFFKNEKEQIYVLLLLYISFVIASDFSPLIGGVVIEYISWRACFVIILVIQILIFIVISRFFKETIVTKKHIPHPVTFIGSYIMFFCTRNFNACALISGLLYGCYFGFIPVSSFIFINKLGFTPKSYALVFILLSIAYMTSNILLRHLNKIDIKKSKIILCGCILNIIGAFALFLCVIIHSSVVITIIIMLFAAVMMRLGLGLTLPIAQIYVMNIFNKNSGQVIGALGFVQSITAGIAIALITRFNDLIFGLFVINGIFAVIALFVYKFVLTEVRFSSLKYKILKSMLHSRRMRKFIIE